MIGQSTHKTSQLQLLKNNHYLYLRKDVILMSKQTNENINNGVLSVLEKSSRKKGRRIEENTAENLTKGGKELFTKETEQLKSDIKKAAENENKNIGILGIFSKGKLKVLRPIGDGKKWLETTFNITHDGKHELAGSRTISQAEAQEMIDKARKEGRLIERNKDGKLTMGGRELSAKETEVVNNADKQTDEIFKSLKDGELPKKNQDEQNTLNGKELSAKKLELPKVTAQKMEGTPKTTPNSAIADSLKRINGKISALTAGKNTRNQQYQKPAKSSKIPIK